MNYSSWIVVRININSGGFYYGQTTETFLERKEFVQKLLSAYQPEDAQYVQNMLKDLFGDTLQTMLEAEMDEHLVWRPSRLPRSGAAATVTGIKLFLSFAFISMTVSNRMIWNNGKKIARLLIDNRGNKCHYVGIYFS